ncbi:ankyrin repeat protein [Megavirus chiliensis]|uniref:Ankyrin repeat protein n=2 Tax=Megamimivirinae TaxID=3044648 RepID=A0A2L2DLK5_MIMIV|nr:putative ankyrin repeat protein [Megavirus chiliensis]AEQ32885.1 ankyrin repeat protein [Megavirus chiliensis]AVG47052.1 ankyrin repeat protein [Acanthamoeba polyphaga mimivirus]
MYSYIFNNDVEDNNDIEPKSVYYCNPGSERVFIKPSFDAYKNTEIYKYYIQHKDNIDLSSVIKKNKLRGTTDSSYYLYNTYNDLLQDNKFMDIIMQIIHIGDKFENNHICLAAIYSSKYHILDELVSMGIDLNAQAFTNSFSFRSDNPLLKAIELSDLDMIKYLINNGADPKNNNNDAIVEGLISPNLDIFEYFSQFEINYENIVEIFKSTIGNFTNGKNTKPIINYLLDQGLDINEIYNKDITIFNRLKIDIFEFLLENNLCIDSRLLNESIACGNLNITEYMLEHKYMPSTENIIFIFKIFDINYIRLFMKYNIDLSVVSGYQSKDTNILDDLTKNGLDYATIINYMLDILIPTK